MADMKRIQKGLKDAGDIAQSLAALGVAVTLVEPVAKSIGPRIEKT